MASGIMENIASQNSAANTAQALTVDLGGLRPPIFIGIVANGTPGNAVTATITDADTGQVLASGTVLGNGDAKSLGAILIGIDGSFLLFYSTGARWQNLGTKTQYRGQRIAISIGAAGAGIATLLDVFAVRL